MLISDLLLLTKQIFGFTDVDINAAGFTETDLIPQFPNDQGEPDPLTKQWGQRLANNTAHNKRRTEQMIFLANDPFTFLSASQDTREYDTDRNYVNKYVAIRLNAFSAIQSLPFTAVPLNRDDDLGGDDSYLNVVYIRLTTSLQDVIGGTASVPIEITAIVRDITIAMRARNMADGGGIEIRVTTDDAGNFTIYLIGTIHELRQLDGANV